MKKEEYTPQFEFDDTLEEVPQIHTCKGCGRTGAYLGLDRNGLCFYCREKTTLSEALCQLNKNTKLSPNYDLFLEYGKTKLGFDPKRQSNDDFIFYRLFGALYSPKMFLFHLPSALIVIVGIILSAIIAEFSLILSCILAILSLAGSVLYYAFRWELGGNRTKNKFEKYNHKTVLIHDNTWSCPFCKMLNTGKEHCERCGVLPVLIEESEERTENRYI